MFRYIATTLIKVYKDRIVYSVIVFNINKVNRTTEVQLKTIQPSEMALLSNSWWQNRKERPYRSTNNEDMVQRPKLYVVCELVSE